jgi:tetratricopeptide (TPR) repeat protein
MDKAKDKVRERIDDVNALVEAGDFRRAIETYKSILRDTNKKILTGGMEYDVLSGLSQCLHELHDNAGAFPHAKRASELARDIYGKKSKEYAVELRFLGDLYRELKDYHHAKQSLLDSLTIMEQANLQAKRVVNQFVI